MWTYRSLMNPNLQESQSCLQDENLSAKQIYFFGYFVEAFKEIKVLFVLCYMVNTWLAL